jgi:glutamate-1-semialdehyde aminotransferase
MHTDREEIAFCGYHGSQDWYCITTPRSQGVPKDLAKIIHKFEWNNINSLKNIFKERKDKIAAVIFEVPAIDPHPGFLDAIKDLAHKNGAIVILDEVVTQARYGPRGAAGKFNFIPDLTACGKGFANGMPIGILAGKKEIMNELADKGFMSMTFSGEAVSLAAALATIKEMKKNNFFKHEEKIGTMFRKGFEVLTKKYDVDIRLGGNWARTILTFYDWDGNENNKIKTLFLQEMLRNKVICLGAPFFFTLAMKEKDIKFALNACDKALAVVAKAYKQRSTDGYLMCPEVGTAFTRGSGSR